MRGSSPPIRSWLSTARDRAILVGADGGVAERPASYAVRPSWTAWKGAVAYLGELRSAGPWVPVGAGVHGGRAWFGVVGEGSHVELTAVGDVVNTAARLASQAGAGEVLVSSDAAAAAGLDAGIARRKLELKGKEFATEVISLRLDPPAAQPPH